MSVPTKVLRHAASAVYIYDKADNAIKWYMIGRDAIDPATRNEAYLKAWEEVAKMAGIGIPVYYIEKVLQKSGLDLVFDSMKDNQTLQEYLARQGFKTELFKFGLAKTLEAFVDKFSEYSGQRGWLDPVFDAVNGKFTSAENFVFRVDPLALDLDGDGIETVGTTAGVKFDFDGDGVKTGTGWVSPDDGFLVLDRNLNGFIDTGAELFGVDTVKSSGNKAVNGFDALSDLDSNADGVFDARDAKFNSVQIWQDKNRDGISQTDELKKLSELKIQSIGLSSVSSGNVQQENVIAAVGVFTYEDGHTGLSNGNQSLAVSLDLASNPFYTQFPAGEVSDEALLLPNMAGSGAVRDLVEAATLSPELLAKLKAYSQATSREQQLSLMDELLEAWSATSDSKVLQDRIEGLSGGGVFKFVWSWEVLGGEPTPAQIQRAELIEKIAILEVFNGRSFFDFNLTPNESGGFELKIRSGAFENVKSIEALGEGQQVTITEQDLFLNFAHEQLLNESYSELINSVYQGLLEQTRLKPYLDSIILSDDLTHWDLSGLVDKLQQNYDVSAVSTMIDMLELLSSSAGDLVTDQIPESFGVFYNALSESNRLLLLAQVEGLIVGGDLDEILKAGLESSYIFGGKGNDSILGAGGNDSLVGGDGADSISGGGGADLLLGGNGDDILSGQSGHDHLVGGEGNDQLHGDDGSDTLEGGEGNDTLHGGLGTNQLFGDEGDDLLLVDLSSTNNVLAGGSGNDQMFGGYYADTYLFNLGDGKDIITENDGGAGAVDTLRFGVGILASDINIRKVGSDLVFMHNNGTDQVTVKGWFADATSSAGLVPMSVIDRIEFADGTVLNWVEILASGIKQEGNDSDETINGWKGNDIIHGGDGNDTVDGGLGSNQLFGDGGNDTLIVDLSAANNVLAGGTGDDQMSGGYYADTYLFNLGDGKDTITENDGGWGTIDILRFGAGILVSDIQVYKSGSDVVFMHRNGTDQVTVKNGLTGATLDASERTMGLLERIEFADGTVLTWAEISAQGLHQQGGSTDDIINGSRGNDIIHGGGGNDTVNGGVGSNQLFGDEGNDLLKVDLNARNNVLAGGSGDDQMYGGYYADTYLFNLGDGKDTITENDGVGAIDTLRFGTGILASDINTRKVGSDLVFVHRNGTDQVTVKGWFDGTSSSAGVVPMSVIDRIEFADGTVLNWTEIVTNGLKQQGNESDETINGWKGNDIIHGGGGDDTVDGGLGSNQLFGDGGNDTLIVDLSAANNVLAGGTGDDQMSGGYYADTYLFNLGDGKDTITENDGGWGTIDILRFGAGILVSDIQVYKSGSDVVFMHRNGTDQVTVKNGLTGATLDASERTMGLLERIEFADGTVLTWAEISAQGLHQQGGSTDDIINGSRGNDIIHGGGGNDTVNGGVGSNQLFGDEGNDLLKVDLNARNNVLAGGSGDDQMYGGYYADTYLFNLGDGKDTITENDGVGAIDTLRFGTGILASDINTRKVGSDLVFVHRNGTDQVTVKGWFDGTSSSAGVVPMSVIDRIEFADGTVLNWTEMVTNGLKQQGNESDETINGWKGNDIIHGGDGNDTVDGGLGSNQLFGDGGNDTLIVDLSAANNVLAGGTGDDQMYGGYSADTYLFNLGDGKDTITENDGGWGTIDILRFGAGILVSDIQVYKSGSDVVFMHRNGTDQVTVKNGLTGATLDASERTMGLLERIEFADGTVLTWAEISAQGLHQQGGSTDDIINGSRGNDIIHGGGGNDTINGGVGSNQLFGDKGDDTLIGGYFADTYVFNLGDGQDVVTDYDAGNVATDTLRFGPGILASDITTRRVNSDLVFLHSNGTDQITFKGWFDGATSSAGAVINNIIERVEFADGTLWTWADMAATGLNQVGTAAVETLIGWSGNDIIHGGGGNDTLSGGTGANQLYGDIGDDTITVATGSKGNTLVGGTGNDTLTGGYFADTYVFNLGDGQDVVTDYDAGNVATDTLRFGPGILAGDITTRRVNSDLVFLHSNGTDQITFKGWFDGATSSAGVVINNIIERVEFADGTFWSWADIVATGLNQSGTEAAETLTGWSGNDIIHGGGGNDTLSGGTGANQLYGDIGDDTITVATGSKGNTLVGGTGDDTLTGGYFADTYVFNLGDGQDVVTDYDAGNVATDTLRFGIGILASDITTRRVNSDLVFLHSNGTDQITFKGWFDGATSSAGAVINNIIERVEFADGTLWTWADMVATGLNQTGTAGDDALIGFNGRDIIRGGSGNDTLDGGAGTNQLFGEAGNDVIQVAYNSRSNTLAGGAGNDTLTGGYFADTYLFNLGDGQDTIIENDPGYGEADTLRFGPGILTSDIIMRRSGSDLLFVHRNGTDQVTVRGWFDGVTSSAAAVTQSVLERVEFADGTLWTWADIAATGLNQAGTAGDDALIGFNGNDIIRGGSGNDTLDGGAGTNQLFGEAGNDVIQVAYNSRSNTLAGGAGNDTLTGGYFSDTYLFNLGDGQDTITDYDPGYGGIDTLRFGAGILASDIQAYKSGADVVFMHSNGIDQIKVKGWFDGTTSSAAVVTQSVLERIEFADGASWSLSDIAATGLRQMGTTGGDTLLGSNGNDNMYGGDGNDTLDGGAGTNRLFGEKGNDVIQVATNSRDNILAGGMGNDTLSGGYFSDTYLFNRDDGQDTINEYDPGYGATDVLAFGADVSPQDLWFRRSGSDLEISVVGANDKVTIGNWYQSSAYHIEAFKTVDGKGLLDSQVQSLVDTMASFGVPAGAETSLTADQRTQLDTVLAANWK
ncbi:calcium-binding protein [Pseudomonas kilonensis]|uniref:calcium-binding protein n=1 Tax=Pseudomonas kilonensis TaxID=132476 RepID=UPI0020A04F99|nr:calcium-binding protein [Pseudomonas kilonensis]MCP1456103.1 Ca2+-binding RTX toxin-like protein [Pseudomonas kilonensis]